MNSKKNSNIYQLSKEIEDEDDKIFAREAKKIVNAYREVQQIKVPKSHVNKNYKQEIEKPKGQSAYAIKIKETLKQINANKTKQIENLARNLPQRQQVQQISSHARVVSKLEKASLNKLFDLMENYNERIVKQSFNLLLQFYKEDRKKQDGFIIKFMIFKLFRAWKKQSLKAKMEQKKRNQQIGVEALKSLELAKQFHMFVCIKKCFGRWQIQTKKQIKRKKYQMEQKIKQFQQKQKQKLQKIKPQKSTIEPVQNSQLQNKMKGFLNGLKQKIQNKDRLKTIKQKTEESNARIIMSEQSNEHIVDEEQDQNQLQNDSYQNQIQSNMAVLGQSQIIIQPPQPVAAKKPMTNEQLEKKRKQLEAKHKNRKQAVEKLKKEKEEKRKQQQKLRLEIEKQLESEQKKIKQQKYKQYIKNKQDQQEWQKRQKQLQVMAQRFDRFRLLKYYGWNPLKSMPQVKKQNINRLYTSLLMIVFRVRAQAFLKNIEQLSAQILQNQYERMAKRYRINLLSKGLKAFDETRKQQLQVKSKLTISHEVNTIKIFFAQWKRAMPALTVQNFDWERPRLKRSAQFNRLQLLYKSFRSLKLNKEEEQKNRCIAQQKDKIKNKIRNMLQEGDEINYEQFL